MKPIRYTLLISVSLASFAIAFAQEAPPNGDQNPVLNPLVKVCTKDPTPPCAKTPPRIQKAPGPQYSSAAKKGHVQGLVTLWLAVGTDGKPYRIRVEQSLGHGLDEEAMKAVKKWRFSPGKDESGSPVAVAINVEVNFRLY